METCPFCATDYTTAQRVIIDEGTEGELVHVTCPACQKAMVLSIERTATRMRSVGVMTDCNAKDYRRFSHAHRVTLDDVLRVHQGLRR